MRNGMMSLLLALSLVLAGACGGGKKESLGHDHDHGDGEEHSHAAGDHEDADGGHEHGEVKHELGEQAAGAWKVRAIQMDEVKAGGETVFYVHVNGDAAMQAGRIWVGDETAAHSVKSLLEHIEADRHHAHVEIPHPLGEGDKFWIEVDGADGTQAKASFDLKR